ncbi:21082_t:CDS:1, partial [Cetraspora pellucida]
IIAELKDTKEESWNLHKIRIQSIFRAFRLPCTPETQIDKLNQ